MGRRCDKCRTEYDSGVDYSGKDYCMTCYVRVRQEEDAKRRKEELRREDARKLKEKDLRDRLETESRERKERMRKEALGSGAYGSGGMAAGRRSEAGDGSWTWHNRMMERRDKADDDKKKREIEEAKLFEQQQAELLERRKAEIAKQNQEDDGKEKHYWSVALDKQKEAAGKAKIEAGKERAILETAVSQSSFAVGQLPRKASRHEAPEDRVRHSRGYRLETAEQPALTLEATRGLPVSLSVGQKGNLMLLLGKNHSQQKIAVELLATLVDSRGKKIEMKLEPGKCAIDTNSEAAFSVKFDLKDDAPHGAMAFTGQLRETAIYVDKDGGQSEVLRLECEVKTPLELEYKRKSAAFKQEDGKLWLLLAFENKGESGGILSPKSGVSYGEEGNRLRAELSEKAKIKGKEKNVLLKFLAEKESLLEKLTLDLSGVDSNGKPYKLQKTIAEKRARA